MLKYRQYNYEIAFAYQAAEHQQKNECILHVTLTIDKYQHLMTIVTILNH